MRVRKRPAAVPAALLACLLAVLAVLAAPGPADADPGPARRGGRDLRPALERRLRDRDAPDRLAQRAAAGLAALSARAEVNGRLAAVGFCFGGLAALTLARSGASLAAVVSMDGSLATTKRAEPGAVTAKVLVCHGALDPHVPMADVAAFTEEMTRAGADWQVNV